MLTGLREEGRDGARTELLELCLELFGESDYVGLVRFSVELVAVGVTRGDCVEGGGEEGKVGRATLDVLAESQGCGIMRLVSSSYVDSYS